MSKYLIFIATLLLLVVGVNTLDAQLGLSPTTFSPGQTISSATFTQLMTNISSKALNRTGGTMTGALLFSADNTHDVGATGATRPRDLHLGRNALVGGNATVTGTLGVTGTSTLAALTLSGAFNGTSASLSSVSAAALDVAGGIQAGSGNVGIVDTTGKIPAISSIYFASLSGANLTGIPETAITDGTLLARLAASETVTGAWTFTAGLASSTANANVSINNTSATADNRAWFWRTIGDTFNLTACNDATSSCTEAMTITRSGAVAQVVTTTAAVAYSAAITPAALSVGNNNDYNPAGLATSFLVRLTSVGAPTNFTGLTTQPNGSIRALCNIGAANSISIVAEDVNSVAANRFTFARTIAPQGCALVMYDGTSQRWRQIGF